MTRRASVGRVRPADPPFVSAAGIAMASHSSTTSILAGRGALERAWRSAPTLSQPRFLARIALDRFRFVNEQYGPETGDRILAVVAATLSRQVTDTDIAARWGGAEFAVLLLDVEAADAQDRVDGIVESIRALEFDTGDRETFRVTASAGLSPADPEKPLEEAAALAGRYLELARKAGGNRSASPATHGNRLDTLVVVAEDDDLTATILEHRLKKEGFRILRFHDGAEAYEGAIRERASLILLDIKMPGMDGLEVLARLRRVPAYERVPIVMLTSIGSESDIVRAFREGADDYVLKPFSPIELVARVKSLLARHSAGPA